MNAGSKNTRGSYDKKTRFENPAEMGTFRLDAGVHVS